jgi:1-acyl-sn-glycerol-3-phosphate acyltransferase
MRWLKFLAIVSLWAFFFVFLAFVHLWINLLKLPNRWEIISRFNYGFTFLLRAILNLKVSLDGDPGQIPASGTVIISNHLSYVDGFVLGSIFPAVFVSKREVKKWPIIGFWATLCGTIFINRQKKNQIGSLIDEMSRKLNQTNILLFPEGRATNGERMLPFQTAPLAALLRNRSTIIPITLRYKCLDDVRLSKDNRDLVYCYDEMDFVPHFWKLLSVRQIEVVVTVRRQIDCSRYPDNSAGRKQLARDCYNRVLGTVGEYPRQYGSASAHDDETR